MATLAGLQRPEIEEEQEVVNAPQHESLEDDFASGREPTYQEVRQAAVDRQAAEADRKARSLAALEAQEEIEGNWFTNAFKNSEEGELEDDGFIDNTVEVVMSGGEVAIEQMVRSIGDLGDKGFDPTDKSHFSWSMRFFAGDKEFTQGVPGVGIPFTNKRIGVMSGWEFANASLLYEISTGKQVASMSTFDIPDQDRPDSAAGQMAQAFMQFAIVFAATRRHLGTAATARGQIGLGMAAGGIADFAAFDPHEARLSNLLTEVGEGDTIFNNALTAYLAADEMDSALEGRMKNAIEGSILGGMLESVMMGVRWYRFRKQKELFDAIEDEADTMLTEAQNIAADVVDEGPNPDAIFENLETRIDDTLPNEKKILAGGDEELGKLEVLIDGDVHRVRKADIVPEHQAQGNGNRLYAEAARQADEAGAKLVSDFSVSEDAARVWESMERQGQRILDQRIENPENIIKWVDDDGVTRYKTKDKTPVFERLEGEGIKVEGDAGAKPGVEDQLARDVAPESKPATTIDADGVARENVGVTRIEEEIAGHFKLNSTLPRATLENLAKQISEGNFQAAGELVNFNGARIEWDAMADGDNLQQLLIAFENAIDPMIKEATGGRVPLAQTKRMGQLIGANAQEAVNLFGDLKGNGGISARMFAAHQAMVASGGELLRLARLAKKTGNSEDMFNFHRHIELHAGLMATVKGSQTEIARALSAMRLMKSAAAESFHEFEEVKRLMSGHKDSQSLIDGLLIRQKKGAISLRDTNAYVTKTTGRKFSDLIAEVAINGLLSSPKTHVINLMSNAGMTILAPMERYIAAGVGALRGTARGSQLLREANAAVMGMLRNSVDAARLAGRAFAEGRPISDLRQRVEFDNRRVIKGDEGTTVGRAINLIGAVVRIPTRALLAGDEFFKSINKQGELHAQAYRLAAEAGDARNFKSAEARNAWLKKEMRRRVQNPTPDMEAHAIQTARRNTFQESAETAFGPAVEKMLNWHPLWKLMIAPFVRTPMNLLRQAFVDRNPIMFAFVKKNRDLISVGGREGDAVIARAVSGTGLMVGAYALADAGIITGKGEHYLNSEKLDKRPEYGFQIGDNFYTFNRLDPVGSILGLVVDMHYAYNHGYDPSDPDNSMLGELSQAVGLAYMTGALNKTWMKSLNDLMETAVKATEGAGPTAKKAMDQFIANQLMKVVPYSSALRGVSGTMDPVVREAWTIRDRIFKNLPGLSQDMPPQRDLLGREITRENAMWYWINPFGANPESDSVVDQELARLTFDNQMIPRSINGVQLDSAQYSRLKGFIFDTGHGAPTLDTILEGMITDPGWKDIPTDAMRIKIVKALIGGRLATAKALLMSTDESYRDNVIETGIREQAELTGQDPAPILEEMGLDK